MEATTRLVCLVLARDTFVAILGPLEALMAREKSVAVVSQRLARLASKGAGPHMPAEVLIKRRRRSRAGGDAWEVVRARGHLDEVQALRSIAAGAHAFVPLSWGGLHFLNALTSLHYRNGEYQRLRLGCSYRDSTWELIDK